MKGRSLTYIVYIALFSVFFLNSCNYKSEPVRERIDINKNWKFTYGDSPSYKEPGFNDVHWRYITVPHNLNIDENFRSERLAVADLENEKKEIAWYRNSFNLPVRDTARRVYIMFEGVYHNSEVFINGKRLVEFPKGDLGFQHNLTPYLSYGDQENVLAVKVRYAPEQRKSSCLETGIFNSVWLEKTYPIHIKNWGTHITTTYNDNKKALVDMVIYLNNDSYQAKKITVVTNLFDSKSELIATKKSILTVKSDTVNKLNQTFVIHSPELWSLENSCEYRACSRIELKNKEVDCYETTFDIR